MILKQLEASCCNFSIFWNQAAKKVDIFNPRVLGGEPDPGDFCPTGIRGGGVLKSKISGLYFWNISSFLQNMMLGNFFGGTIFFCPWPRQERSQQRRRKPWSDVLQILIHLPCQRMPGWVVWFFTGWNYPPGKDVTWDPPNGKAGKSSSQKYRLGGDMLVPRRVLEILFFCDIKNIIYMYLYIFLKFCIVVEPQTVWRMYSI